MNAISTTNVCKIVQKPIIFTQSAPIFPAESRNFV